MYYYHSALVLEKGKNKRWTAEDISRLTVRAVYDTYFEAYVRIYRIVNGNPVYRVIRMSDIFAGDYQIAFTATMELWLVGYPSSLTLPSVGTNLPSISTAAIKYSDGWRAGWDVRRIPYFGSPDADQPLGVKTDLLLTRFGVVYSDYDENCLITVNGLLHNFYIEPGYGIRVLGGGRSNDICRKNNFGMISFRELGGASRIAITTEMVSQPDGTDLKDGALINLGVDLTGKSVLLSLGGYLHAVDDIVNVIGPETGLIKVDIQKSQIYPRLFESQQIIDLDVLEMVRSPADNKAISQSEFMSDTVLRKYLTMSQTFAIVVNSPVLYRDKHHVQRSKLPGVLYELQEPLYPIQLATGIMPEYWVRREDDMWAIGMDKDFDHPYQFTTTDWVNSDMLIPDTLPFSRDVYAMAEYLILGKETLTW